MSIVNRNGEKVYLSRVGPHHLWLRSRDRFGQDPLAWRRLTMLALREGLHWPLGWIADAFELHKGNVSRGMAQAQRDLRAFLLDEAKSNADHPPDRTHSAHAVGDDFEFHLIRRTP